MASQGKGFVMPRAGTELSCGYENLQGFSELSCFTQRKALGTEVCANGEIQSMKTAGGRKKECFQCFKGQSRRMKAVSSDLQICHCFIVVPVSSNFLCIH